MAPQGPLGTSDRQNALLTKKLRQLCLADTAVKAPDAVDFDLSELPEDPSDAYLRRTRGRVRNRLQHSLYDFSIISLAPGWYLPAFDDFESFESSDTNPMRSGVIAALKVLYRGVDDVEIFRECLLTAMEQSLYEIASEEDSYVKDITLDLEARVEIGDLDNIRELHSDGENIPPKAAWQLYHRDEMDISELLNQMESAYYNDEMDVDGDVIDFLKEAGRI